MCRSKIILPTPQQCKAIIPRRPTPKTERGRSRITMPDKNPVVLVGQAISNSSVELLRVCPLKHGIMIYG